MKIAMIAQPFDDVLPPKQNSIGLILYEKAIRLARSEEVVVYLKSNSTEQTTEISENICCRHISLKTDQRLLKVLNRAKSFFRKRRPLFASRWYYLNYMLKVAMDLRMQNCDVVHIFNFTQLIPIIRMFNPEIKIVLEMQCEWLNQLDCAILQKRLEATDLILGVSDYITEKIRLRFPEITHRCHTGLNGVNTELFVPPLSANQSVPADRPKKLLFVGRVSPEKGVHLLVEAMEQIIETHSDVTLEIIGPRVQLPLEYIVGLSCDEKVAQLSRFYNEDPRNQYNDYLDQRIKELGLSEKIRFLGSIPNSQLLTHYQEADILINPSFSESFGISLIEAMATSTPVIATYVGGMSDIISNGQTGFLVESGESAGLAIAVNRLLTNDLLRQVMGNASRKRVLQYFSWDQVTQQLLNHYQKLTGAPLTLSPVDLNEENEKLVSQES